MLRTRIPRPILSIVTQIPRLARTDQPRPAIALDQTHRRRARNPASLHPQILEPAQLLVLSAIALLGRLQPFSVRGEKR
jgi:hypothetical protein